MTNSCIEDQTVLSEEIETLRKELESLQLLKRDQQGQELEITKQLALTSAEMSEKRSKNSIADSLAKQETKSISDLEARKTELLQHTLETKQDIERMSKDILQHNANTKIYETQLQQEQEKILSLAQELEERRLSDTEMLTSRFTREGKQREQLLIA